MSIYYSLVTIMAAILVVRTLIALARKRSARRAVVAATVALFVCSVVIGYFSFDHLSNLRAMRDWPTVAGTVIESRTIGEKAIVPYVVYSYDVNSVPFLGTSDLGTPAFGNKSKRLNEAETLLSEYPVGKQVVVHYNALDPSPVVHNLSRALERLCPGGYMDVSCLDGDSGLLHVRVSENGIAQRTRVTRPQSEHFTLSPTNAGDN